MSSSSFNNVVFPDAMTHLGVSAVECCHALTNCHLPAQMEYIDEALFWDTPINNITIPEGVTRIDSWAFDQCPQLKELRLPAAVTEIADSVFTSGTKLDILYMGAAVPPTIYTDTFEDFSAQVIVPQGAAQAYRDHEFWGRFANIKEEE